MGQANGPLGGQLREPSVFGNVGGTSKVEAVTVGIRERGVPHGVADEGFRRFEATGFEFMVKSNGILALKPERDAFADFARGDPGVVALCGELLKHERGAAKFQPTPTDFFVDNPPVLDRDA